MNSRIILIGIITHAFPTKTEQTGHKEKFLADVEGKRHFNQKRRETRIFYFSKEIILF